MHFSRRTRHLVVTVLRLIVVILVSISVVETLICVVDCKWLTTPFQETTKNHFNFTRHQFYTL